MENSVRAGSSTWAATIRRCLRHDLVFPLLVYFIGLLPFNTTFLLFYPDERFYVDASLTMYQTGDVMVPRFDDGSPRLNKPVLTYWIMLASYHVFGVHLLAARLPFLLAGAGVLCLTYRLAILLTEQRRIAKLAVWIMLANPLFWLSCMRCLPDILLALFALMTVLGYFTLQKRQWNHAPSAWLLFGGLGLAFGAKGLPALLLLGCLVLHTVWWRRQAPFVMTKALGLPLVSGVLIGVVGFLPILWNHADETVAEMWRDQFASRLVGKTWGVVYRLPLLLLTLLGLFLPWIVPSLLHLGRAVFQIRPRTPWETCLALTGMLWLGATAATENCSVRYLFPLFPWLAVTLASAVARCDAALLERYSRWLLVALAGLVICLLLVAAAVTLQFTERAWTVCGIAVIGASVGALVQWAWSSDAWRRLTVAGGLGPVTLLAGFLAIAPLLLPDLGTQARRSLASIPGEKDTVAVLGSACQASRIRLALAPWQTEVQRTLEAAGKTPAILMARSYAERLPTKDYDLYPAARLLERVAVGDCLATACRGELESFLETQTTVYCWAVRKVHRAP